MFAFLKNLFRRKKPEPVVDPANHFGDEKKCPFLHPPTKNEEVKSSWREPILSDVSKEKAASLYGNIGGAPRMTPIVRRHLPQVKSRQVGTSHAERLRSHEVDQEALVRRRLVEEDERRRAREDEAVQERQRHALWLSMPDDAPTQHYSPPSAPHYYSRPEPCEEQPSASYHSPAPSYQCDTPSSPSPSYDPPSYDSPSSSYNLD